MAVEPHIAMAVGLKPPLTSAQQKMLYSIYDGDVWPSHHDPIVLQELKELCLIGHWQPDYPDGQIYLTTDITGIRYVSLNRREINNCAP